MKTKDLAKLVKKTLEEIDSIAISLEKEIYFKGNNLEELNKDIKTGIENRAIHKAGVYIIGTESDILYIGDGGKSNKNEDEGTMGHRIIQHLYKTDWRDDARNVCFIPVYPREFSRLAEQIALAIYFHKYNKLPSQNKDWK